MHRDSSTRPALLAPWATALTVCIGALLTSHALAQGVYRIVGADGRVTFSDQPPSAQTDATPLGHAGASNVAANANAQLPLALRQIVSRYPVTLYTSTDCAPCNSGRNLLTNRGIPFTEKTVSTNEDIDAFKRLSGDMTIPMISIGGQRLKGFSDREWTQYLNAAEYPQQSSLPANYRRPAATPLVEAKTVTPAPLAEAAPRDSVPAEPPAEPPVAPPVQKPAGIRF